MAASPATRHPPPRPWTVGLAWLRVLLLCAYPILGTAIAFYFTAFSDQGVDLLLDSLNELAWGMGDVPPGFGSWQIVGHVAFAALSVIVAALSIWSPARLLVVRNFKYFPVLYEKETAALRKWLPRLLGSIVVLGVAVGYARLGLRFGLVAAWVSAAVWAGAAIVLCAVLSYRREWWSRSRKLANRAFLDPTTMHDWAGPGRRLVVALCCGFYVAVSIAFAIWPVGFPRFFGGTALIFFGVGGLTFIVTMVVAYLPLAKGYPSLTVPLALWVVICSMWLDNHDMRPVADRAGQPLSHAVAVKDRATEWHTARQGTTACGKGDAVPMVYVAAAGGGIRAGYWTARVLEELSLQVGPDFDCALFALSGVSGGSLGVAGYVATNRENGVPRAVNPKPRPDKPDDKYVMTPATYRASDAIGEDFLSPAVAGLLFYDAVQRVFPVPISFLDRSRGLETAFQQAFDGVEGQPFRYPVRDLDGASLRMPMLFLNSTVVEDGRRSIHSNANLTGFDDVYDLGCSGKTPLEVPTTTSISLASAVHNSARFTYVSPAGRVAHLGGCSALKAADARIVDGGYFENSGAATLTMLLGLLTADGLPGANGNGGSASTPAKPRDRPILLLVRNSPGTEPYCLGAHASDTCIRLNAQAPVDSLPSLSRFLPEVTTPLRALMTVREQRERLAIFAAAEAFKKQDGVVVEVTLPTAREVPEPPLGWSLSRGVRKSLDDDARALVSNCRSTLQALFATGKVPAGACNPLPAKTPTAIATGSTATGAAAPAASAAR